MQALMSDFHFRHARDKDHGRDAFVYLVDWLKKLHKCKI